MGCDIHGTIERRVNGKWVMVNRLQYQFNTNDTTENPLARNYRRFAAIAGVRGDGGLEPRGVPSDVSESSQLAIDEWDGDGHSHTWLTIEEACCAFLMTAYSCSNFALECPAFAFFGLEPETGDEHRLVLWFDN